MTKLLVGLSVAVILLTAFAIAEPLIHEVIRDKEVCRQYKGCQSDMPDTAALFGAIIGLLALGTVAAGLLVRTMVTGESEKRVEQAEQTAVEAIKIAKNSAYEISRSLSSGAYADAMHQISYGAWLEYYAQTREDTDASPGLEHAHDEQGWPEIRDKMENKSESRQAELRLKSAISFARSAYRRRNEFGDEPEAKRLRVEISNSLLYYLAELGDPKDREEAYSLLAVLDENRDSFPQYQSTWDDTITHLRKRWS